MGQSKLATTPKSSTPFAGLVSFIAWLRQIGCYERIAQAMPFSYASPNAIPLADALCAFLVSVIRGAARCAHCDWLRFDSALHAMLASCKLLGAGGGGYLLLFAKDEVAAERMRRDLRSSVCRGRGCN